MPADETLKAGRGVRGLVGPVIARALQSTAVRAVLHYAQHRGPMLANSITYRALFSVFAALLLLFSAATVWLSGNPQALGALLDSITVFLPGISDTIDLEQAQLPLGFTLVGVLSLVGLIGAALGAIGSLRAAFRLLAGVSGDESFFLWVLLRNLLVGVAFGGMLLAAALFSLLTSSGMSLVAGWLGISERSAALEWGTRGIGLVVALAVNTLAIAVAFRLLSGTRPTARALWGGALAGGVGLLVLQEFSGLFARGATSNPLLASFAALIALLLWINLSAQVILISASFIVTLEAQARDRVREKFGASTLAQFRRRQAEDTLAVATRELSAAQEAERKERARTRGQANRSRPLR